MYSMSPPNAQQIRTKEYWGEKDNHMLNERTNKAGKRHRCRKENSISARITPVRGKRDDSKVKACVPLAMSEGLSLETAGFI